MTTIKQLLEEIYNNFVVGYSLEDFIEIMKTERELTQEEIDHGFMRISPHNNIAGLDFGFINKYSLDESFFKKTFYKDGQIHHNQNIEKLEKDLLKTKPLTNKEDFALKVYTMSKDKNLSNLPKLADKGYFVSTDMNAALYKSKGRAYSKVGKHADIIDKIIDKAAPPKEDFYVYAAVYKKPTRSQHMFHGFQSTSLNPHEVYNHIAQPDHEDKHIMKIKIPKGSKIGKYIGNRSAVENEKEFLLKRKLLVDVHPNPEKMADNFGKTHYIWHATPTKFTYGMAKKI